MVLGSLLLVATSVEAFSVCGSRSCRFANFFGPLSTNDVSLRSVRTPRTRRVSHPECMPCREQAMEQCLRNQQRFSRFFVLRKGKV